MKLKGTLSLEIVFENFTLSRNEIQRTLEDNVEYLINRGYLTDDLDLEVENWSLDCDFIPQDLSLKGTVLLHVRYKSKNASAGEVKSILKGFADSMANRGFLSDDQEIINDWSSNAEVVEIQ